MCVCVCARGLTAEEVEIDVLDRRCEATYVRDDKLNFFIGFELGMRGLKIIRVGATLTSLECTGALCV